MTPKTQQPSPFFMIFPWGKVAGMLFLVVFGAMFIYRLSETGGMHVNRACFFSMIVAGVAGVTGFFAIGKTWGRDVHWVLIGVMVAAAIRLLIGGAGVAIITSFTSVHRSWFVLFLGIYYLAFLGVDTWFALWVLRNCELKIGNEKYMAHYGTCLAKLNPLEHVVSHELFTVSIMGEELSFTNHMLMISVGTLILMIAMPLLVRKRQLVPRGFYNIVETICVFIREDVARPFLKSHTDRYISYLWSIFFFILSLNLLGMIPFNAVFGILTGQQNNWYGAATANLYVTGAMATFAFFLFHIAGIYEKGFVKYFATLSPKVPWPMMPFMFLMELISSFVRLFSLAIRLFANILAGHILLAVLLGFIVMFKTFMVAGASIFATTLMSLLEIFVAFLQAYIFTFLTAIFIGFAISEDH